jgi:hypothetical protein
MMKIKEWKAKRAGGRITITGVDADAGGPVKIVGVDQIEAGKRGKSPMATDKDGVTYELT